MTLGTNVNAQSLIKLWDKRYGGFSSETLRSILYTRDNGFILGGYSYSDSSGDKTQNDWHDSIQNNPTADYWVVKTDSLGNKQWDKRFGGKNHDILSSLQQADDGDYVLTGGSASRNNGDKTQENWDTISTYTTYDFWIVKIDSLGTKKWDKRYGGLKDDFASSSVKSSDGGYLIGGNSWSGIGGDKTQANWDTVPPLTNDFWIIKVDTAGNKQWDKRYGGTDEDELQCIRRTIDGGYLLGGRSSSNVSGDKTQPTWGAYDFWIIKIDSVGNKQWDKRYGSVYNDELSTLEQTNDGGYILGGISDWYASGDKSQNSCGFGDYWIVKIDSIGNKEWDKVYGGTYDEDEFSAIIKTCDGGYLLSGCSYSDSTCNKTEHNLGQEQAWLVKIDSLGNKQWDKTIFTRGHDENAFLLKLTNQCFVLATYYFISDTGGYRTESNWDTTNMWTDYWFMKFCDTTLTIGCNLSLGIKASSFQPQLSVYPNPFTSEISITIQKQSIKQATFTIKNILGQTIFINEENNISSKYTKTINLSFISKGIYLLDIIIDGERTVKKILKE